MRIEIGVTPWLIGSGASYWGEFLFVEVGTDQGITGWARSPPQRKSPIARSRRCFGRSARPIAGEDATGIERLWHKLFRSFTYMGSRGAAVQCLSAIDIALWDIHGKAFGKPIYELLGGPVRDEIAALHPPRSAQVHQQGAHRRRRSGTS